jgi:hypothetical protein
MAPLNKRTTVKFSPLHKIQKIHLAFLRIFSPIAFGGTAISFQSTVCRQTDPCTYTYNYQQLLLLTL